MQNLIKNPERVGQYALHLSENVMCPLCAMPDCSLITGCSMKWMFL